MKKTIILIYCLTSFNLALFAQTEDDTCPYNEEYRLDSIDPRFIGVYLPVDFLAALEKTKHYDSAMSADKESMHDSFYERIIVYKNNIRYFYYWGEGYSGVTKHKFPKYQFEYKNRNEIIITDPNGYKYLKMTNDLENHVNILSNYTGKIILNDLINNGDITIEGDVILILSLNKKYEIGTFGYVYNNNENLVLKEYGEHNYYSLEIVNNLYTIYWLERNFYTSYKTVKRVIWEKQL
jgi:hypothetical protein